MARSDTAVVDPGAGRAEALLHELYLADRDEAYKAVSAALATYRWWHWTNLSNMFRVWLTVVKLRLGFKMWPGA